MPAAPARFLVVLDADSTLIRTEAIEPTAGVRELIDAVHARGGAVGVVSGGFHEILDTVAPGLGVDVWRANRLATSDGVLTGLVDGPIVDAAGKAAALRE